MPRRAPTVPRLAFELSKYSPCKEAEMFLGLLGAEDRQHLLSAGEAQGEVSGGRGAGRWSI